MAVPSSDHKVAGAPISWGVCEVPGWGYQLDVERVLGEMREIGLAASEFGPVGFLPTEPRALAQRLRDFDLRGVGGFCRAVAHESDHDPLPGVDAFIDSCLAAEAGVVVLAAVTGLEGYDARVELDEIGWATLLTNLDRMQRRAVERGVVVALHPHAGTMIESAADVDRVLAGSAVGLCVDTGHLLIGGTDPVALTRSHADRVLHVHLKDVDADLAQRLINGELTFAAAVEAGLWVPLGEGAVDVAALIRTLRDDGYTGWYVLEQDVMLDREPPGRGPVADVERCLAYVRKAVA